MKGRAFLSDSSADHGLIARGGWFYIVNAPYQQREWMCDVTAQGDAERNLDRRNFFPPVEMIIVSIMSKLREYFYHEVQKCC